MWVCRKYSPAAKAQRGSTAIKKPHYAVCPLSFVPASAGRAQIYLFHLGCSRFTGLPIVLQKE